MPDFLEHIFGQLQRAAHRLVLKELHADGVVRVTASELLAQVDGRPKLKELLGQAWPQFDSLGGH